MENGNKDVNPGPKQSIKQLKQDASEKIETGCLRNADSIFQDAVSVNGSLLLKLPLEMRGIIYNFLPLDSILKLRLVNHQLRKEIEELMSFRVLFDDSSCENFLMKSLLNIRIKAAHIFRLTSRRVLRFAFPERLKSIICDGKISNWQLNQLLTNCPNLEKLALTHETLSIKNLISSKLSSSRVINDQIKKNLENKYKLKNLLLQLIRPPPKAILDLNMDKTMHTNIQYFLECKFPALKYFSLQYSIYEDWTQLLTFIERHVDTLEILHLFVGDMADCEIAEANIQMNQNRLQDFNSIPIKGILSKLQLKEIFFRDDTIKVNLVILDLVSKFLRNQNSIEKFDFHAGLPTMTFVHLVQKNHHTLTEIFVSSLMKSNHEEVSILNVRVFEHCSHLRILNLGTSVPKDQNPQFIQLKNFQYLPKTVEKFSIDYIGIDPLEISLLPKANTSLQIAYIVEAGRSLKYSTLLINFILGFENLQAINVYPISATLTDTIEIHRLNTLFQRFTDSPFDPSNDLEEFKLELIREEDRQWVLENFRSHSNQSNYPISIQ